MSDSLHWVTDSEPGLRRVRRRSGFVYLDARGKAVSDEQELQRIRKLAIPPAYEAVWICARPDGHLQATGRDARGRKQYRYHPLWTAARGLDKFGALQEFGSRLPRLRERIARALKGGGAVDRERVLATMARLLDTTWLRIGNDEYARSNGSFGLSTLQRRHVQLKGCELRLCFKGKSGVRHEVRLEDRRVAGVVRRCRDLPGQELFVYRDAGGDTCRVDSTAVNEWLAEASGMALTAKQFRTWHGSVQALSIALRAHAAGAPMALTAVVAEVARRLGNTAAVCRKSYIHPAVLERVARLATAAPARGDDDATLEPWLLTPPARRGLSVDERRFLALVKAASPPRKRGGKAASYSVASSSPTAAVPVAA